jgi:cytochrome b
MDLMKHQSNRRSTMKRDNTPTTRTIPVLVWDLPVRVFHWLLAFSFAGAYLTAEADGWRAVHVTLGVTAVALACWRIVWGFAGTRYARFSSFVRGPAAVAGYLRSLLRGQPQHFTGHNPAGALAILAMLALTLAAGVTGLILYTGGGEWLEEVHETLANLMLAVVIVHIAAVVLSSWLHRENLVRAMITGRKQAEAGATGGRSHRALGVLLLAAVLGFWYWQYQHPDGGIVGAGTTEQRQGGHHEED